jgi:hypothetical protein
MSPSEKVYRFLLRAYPSHYLARYQTPMEQLFRDRLLETHTLGGRTSLWIRILADWTVTVPQQYWEKAMPHVPQLTALDPARRCLFFARREASSFSRSEIGLEHLLLGILRQDPSLVPDAEAVVRAVEAMEPSGRREPPMEDLRLSRETIRVWEGAKEIAREAGRTEALPQDLIAGILRERETAAARLLRDAGKS